MHKDLSILCSSFSSGSVDLTKCQNFCIIAAVLNGRSRFVRFGLTISIEVVRGSSITLKIYMWRCRNLEKAMGLLKAFWSWEFGRPGRLIRNSGWRAWKLRERLCFWCWAGPPSSETSSSGPSWRKQRTPSISALPRLVFSRNHTTFLSRYPPL